MKKIAIPTREDMVDDHFGHCAYYTVVTLCDSSDISYVFEAEDGMIDIPDEMVYYGEHSFQMQYKDTIGEPFDWLYIDADTLREQAAKNGYAVEVVAEGEHYDYLARITKSK